MPPPLPTLRQPSRWFGTALGVVGLLGVGSGPLPAAAQDPDSAPAASPVVQGQVYDSTRAEPLAGARVILWETPHETYTLEDGSFSFPSLPDGDYSLVYFHPRLIELGLSSGAHPLRVAGDSPVFLSLATPSMLSIQATLCALDDLPPEAAAGAGAVRVAGVVRHAVTGISLPGVEVEAAWTRPGERNPRAVRAHTDSEGWYRLCGLPAGGRIGVRARAPDAAAPRQEFEGVPGSLVRVDLPLGEETTAVVQGTVQGLAADGSLTSLAGATASLDGTTWSTITDTSGRFRFADVPSGAYTLLVSRPGSAPRADPLEVMPGTDTRVEAVLTEEAIPLPPLVVSVRSEMEARALAMGGRVISREDVERVLARSRDVADLLRHQQVPGMVVRRAEAGRSCVEYVPGATRIFRTTCESVQVYVDNIRSIDPQGAIEIPANLIDRMILFRPVEAGNLFGLGAASGVLMVFTRR